MIIECSYYGWQDFFRALDEETMNTGNSAVKCVSHSCKNSLADNIFSLPCLANIEVVGQLKSSNSLVLEPELFQHVCCRCYFLLCFIVYVFPYFVSCCGNI